MGDIEDAAEDSGNITQVLQSRESSNPPELQLTFG